MMSIISRSRRLSERILLVMVASDAENLACAGKIAPDLGLRKCRDTRTLRAAVACRAGAGASRGSPRQPEALDCASSATVADTGGRSKCHSSWCGGVTDEV